MTETPVLKRLFTVEEFHQMAEAGLFGEDDRLELLDGEIVQMPPIGRRHASCVARLTELFGERCRPVAIVNVQNPLVLSGGTELYPDIALLVRRSDFYSESLPQAGDVLLVVEVADTTGDYDRRIKVPLYARAGVAEVWVVDLRERAVDVYTHPAGDAYRTRRRVEPGELLAIPGIADQNVAVDEVLPPS